MFRRTTFNAVTGCDEYRSRKTGKVFAQYRLWPDARPCADGMKHLTAVGNPELARKIAATPAGMAFWTGTGPEGATCVQCGFFTSTGYLYGSCEKNAAFRKAQGEQSPPHEKKPKLIPFHAQTAACRYFRAK